MCKKKISLSKRELDIMNILWNSEKPLTAAEIYQLNPDISINTIQAVVKKLLKLNYIEVADIVYSGTVLCRSYHPLLDREAYMLSVLKRNHVSTFKLISCLIDTEDSDTLDDLEKLIKEKRAAQKENS